MSYQDFFSYPHGLAAIVYSPKRGLSG